MGALGQNEERGKGWCDVYPKELVFTFGGFTSVSVLVKIHQEM